MNNKDYFKYSIDNPDDFFYNPIPQGQLVLSANNEQPPTALMVANHRLIELISTYKTLTEQNLTTVETINNVIDSITNILETTPSINYTAFCTYLRVLDYPYSTYIEDITDMPVEQKRELMRQLLNFYIENRHNLYLFHGYSDQTLQVNSDNAASRRKGKTGIIYLENHLTPIGFIKARNLQELESNNLCYILPDKGATNLFNEYLKKYKIKFDFRKERDNKNPDMLIKIKNHIIILEHKLTNGGGGSQNAEINEIIQFIKYSEKNKKVHYVSCLQGNYFKKFGKIDLKEPKVVQQKQNVAAALTKNSHNYFVNGQGLKKLIRDFIDN